MLIIPIQINHQGCPHQCVFCDQHTISASGANNDDPARIAETVRNYLQSWSGAGSREVAFYGGTFTTIAQSRQRQLLSAIRPFIENGSIDSIRISTRPDAIDPSTLEFLKKHHVKTIELGVQSMSDAVLNAAGRGHSVADTIRACALIQKYHFRLACQLMPGLPGDSTQSMLDSANAVVKLKPDFVRIYPAIVVRGTAMEGLYREGRYTPLGLDDAVEICANMREIFIAANIQIIRIGLQATSDLQDALVCGPYHPAFGEKVISHIFWNRIRASISNKKGSPKNISVELSTKDESAFRGEKNGNITKLKEEYPGIEITLRKRDDLERGTLRIL